MGSPYPFQERDGHTAAQAPLARWIFNYETGLGKTVAAVLAARELSRERILIVTPAIVRSHWLRHIADWWPERRADAAAITMGKDRQSGVSKRAGAKRDAAYQSNIQVVSYSLVKQVAKAPWDLVILDELHRLQAVGSQQSKGVRQIVDANERAGVFGLTATLMPNDILDIWNPLDTIWPGRFGAQNHYDLAHDTQPYSFKKRYSNETKVTVGEEVYTEWRGINPAHALELRERIAACSSSATKAQYAHLLPPMMVDLLRVPPKKQQKYKNLDEWREHNGSEKVPWVIDWLEDALASDSHVFVATHLHATAEAISNAVRSVYPGVATYTITGERYPSPEQRNAALAEARAQPRAILVGTMHSVGIGISLTFCTQALMAELYPRPETMIQFLGRFSRLDSNVPSRVSMLCFEGTVDERCAEMIKRKVDAINLATPAGTADTKLQEALDIKYTEEEMLDNLADALAGGFEEATYA